MSVPESYTPADSEDSDLSLQDGSEGFFGDSNFDFDDDDDVLQIAQRMEKFDEMIKGTPDYGKDELESSFQGNGAKAFDTVKAVVNKSGNLEAVSDPSVDVDDLNERALQAVRDLSEDTFMMSGSSTSGEEPAPDPEYVSAGDYDYGDYGSSGDAQDDTPAFQEPDDEEPAVPSLEDDDGQPALPQEEEDEVEDHSQVMGPAEDPASEAVEYEEPVAAVPAEPVAVPEPPVERKPVEEAPVVARTPDPVVQAPVRVLTPDPVQAPSLQRGPNFVDNSTPIDPVHLPDGQVDIWATYSPHLVSSERVIVQDRLRYIDGLSPGEARQERGNLGLVLITSILCRKASYDVPEGLRLMRGSLDGFTKQQAEWQAKLDADHKSRQELAGQWQSAIEGFGTFSLAQAESAKKQNAAARALSEELTKALRGVKKSSSSVPAWFLYTVPLVLLFLVLAVLALFFKAGAVPDSGASYQQVAPPGGLQFVEAKAPGGGTYLKVVDGEGVPATPYKFGDGVLYKVPGSGK